MKISSFILLLFLSVCSSFLSNCNFRASKPLPAFNILLLDSTTIFNTTQIPEGKPFVLMHFSTDCDHCQREIKDLLSKIDRVKKIKFYLITGNRFEELRRFNDEYKLAKYQNIIVGRDYQLYMHRNFKDATPPYLAIYDENKMQRAVFAGEAKAEKIIEVLKKMEG